MLPSTTSTAVYPPAVRARLLTSAVPPGALRSLAATAFAFVASASSSSPTPFAPPSSWSATAELVSMRSPLTVPPALSSSVGNARPGDPMSCGCVPGVSGRTVTGFCARAW